MFEILAPKLLGKRYEKVLKCIFAAAVVFFGFKSMGYSIHVSQKVILFSNLFFSGTIIMQVLNSEDNARYLRGVFAMPFAEKNFLTGYAAVTGIYVFFTKSILMYVLIMAFSDSISVMSGMLIAVNFVFICLGTMIVYAFLHDRAYISFITAAAGIALCFILPENAIALLVYAVADVFLLFAVNRINPYRFMKTASGKKRRQKNISGFNFPVLKYILRYVLSNKSYLISTAIIIIFSSYLSWSVKDMGVRNGSLIGMAMLSVNTPLAVIVSSSRTLKKKLCSMPDSIRSFYIPYAAVLFLYYILAYSILIMILYFIKTDITWISFLAAFLYSLQASVITVFMEYKYTLTKWSTESDLWHNPRKYIIPVILAAESMIFQLF